MVQRRSSCRHHAELELPAAHLALRERRGHRRRLAAPRATRSQSAKASPAQGLAARSRSSAAR